MIKLTVNGIQHQVDVVPEMPLLWVLRDELGITSPKYGCGVAQCGACTVHIDGTAVRSCQSRIGEVAGKSVVTIDGLANRDQHPVLQAWIEHQVPQCGYCQTGQIMQAISLLEMIPNPTDEQINAGHVRQSMPLRHLSAHSHRDPCGCRKNGGEVKCETYKIFPVELSSSDPPP